MDPAFDTDERPAWGNRGGPGVPVAGSGADAARRLYRLHRRHQALRARSQSGTAVPAWVTNCKTPSCPGHPHVSKRTGKGALILTPHQSSLRANTANALTSANVRHCQREEHDL